MGKDLNVTKEDAQRANKHVKRSSTSSHYEIAN